MATTVTTNTFSSTYKDDYRDSDNYHRILFNSGRALQARELTQMQTIIQNEIARFARNIFTEGAVVGAGGVTVNNRLEYVKLDTSLNPLPSNPQDLIGKTFTVKSPDAAIKFEVRRVVEEEGSDPATLYIKYSDTTDGTPSSVPIRVPNGSTFEAPGVSDLKAVAVGATGTATLASVQDGEFFVQDHFVFAQQQSIFLDKYSSFPTAELGFKTTEEVVTADDDSRLFDNQGASPNLTAPGADRYRIRLTLTTRDLVDSDENFVLVAKVTNGLITKVITGADNYNQINEVLATRTKEESGNYIVNDFTARFDELNDSNLSLDVSGGVAYVDGYRLDLAPSRITVPKAKDTEEAENEVVIPQYGNYVLGSKTDNAGLPDISTFEELDLRTDSNYGGSTIGTARIRAIEENNDNSLKFYLFDINMNDGQSFRDVRSFGNNDSDYVNITTTGGIASLTSDTLVNNLLFELPRNRPTETGVSDIVITVQKKYDFTVIYDGDTGTIVDPNVSAGGNDIFTNVSDFIVTRTNGEVVTGLTFSLFGSPLGSSVGISGWVDDPATAGDYVLIAYVVLDEPQIRSKTLVDDTLTVSWPSEADSDGNGLRFIDLGQADIYKVTRITQDDSDGADLSENFIIDNGQRDNFYGLGRLIEKTGRNVPATDIFVRHKYFSHGAGDLFAVNSYNGAIPYGDIPSYTIGGRTYSLRNVLDFRPTKTASGNFTSSTINLLPKNQDAISADVVYYLPRKDLLVVKSLDTVGQLGIGDITVERGISSVNPAIPEEPANGMGIFTLSLNPFTINDSDTEVQAIDNRRYTMKDISRLESRVSKLAEITSLGLLELDTSTVLTLDSNGLDRTKSGFFADNFEDFAFSDLDDPTYRASREPNAKCMTPAIDYGQCRLFYDSDNGSNTTVKNGDLVTLPFTEAVYEYQNLANEALNVNPFEVIINTGTIQLSPASDDWIEKFYLPDVYISGGVKKRNVGTRTIVKRTFGGWFGVALAIGGLIWGGGILNGVIDSLFLSGTISLGAAGVATGVASSFAFQAASAASSAARVANDLNNVSIASNQAVVRDDVIIKQVSDKVLRIDQIPYMRSVKVFFKAEGLKPNQAHFPFFNGVDVSAWCKQEDFQRFSSNPITYGNTLIKATGHPDGSTGLVSNGEGRIEGSFVIPSTTTLKFRTGTKIFKLLNITADDEDAATSLCQTTFTSSGVLETRQKTLKATREIDVQTVVVKKKSILCFWDPLAQSFLVSQAENPAGIFLTSVDIFFKTKAGVGGQPVQVQVRGMQNGSPLPYALPGGIKYLSPEDVNVPVNLEDLDEVRSTPTRFTFDEPVFLAPGQEYAIVVAAETTDYQVYAAKTYDFVLGSTEARVNKQPTLGSLFRSQNGTTWTPDQNRDLMFRLNRAEFSSTATGYLRNLDPPNALLEPNPFLTDSASSSVRVFHYGHGFIKNDTVTIYGLDSNETYAGMKGTSLLGERTITNADWTGYTFNADSSANSSIRMGGSNVVVDEQMMMNTIHTNVQLLNPNNTTTSASIRLTNGASWADDRNEATSSAYGLDNFKPIILNEIFATSSPKLVPSRKNKVNVDGGSGADAVLIKIDLSTDDTKVSPIIDLQRASMTSIENQIDKQDSASSSGFNIPLEFVNETDPYDGSSASKHISTVSQLADEAVGLKIMFSGYRPSEANFKVYYRTSTDDANIYDQPWVSAGTSSVQADLLSLREYQFLVGGTGGNLPAFTQYQVKIVMETTNSSMIPVIKDLRVIALAV